MLFLAVFLALIGASTAQQTKNHTELIVCRGLIFNNTFYDKTLLFQGSGRSLFVHQRSGDLFFSHMVRSNFDVRGSRLVACHIQSKYCREIFGINGGFCVGYDRINDKIYFGGIDGIYIYNNVTDAAEYFAEEGQAVWGIFIYHNFYYIEYPSQRLYIKKEDEFVASKIRAEVLTIYANEHTIYYSNRSGLYTVEKQPNAEALLLSRTLDIRQITEDINGNIYFCTQTGIFVDDINTSDHTMEKLANITEARGLAFFNVHDENDITTTQVIFSNEHFIYRLLPSKHGKACLAAFSDPANNPGEDKLRQKKLSTIYLDLKLDFV